MTITSQKKVNGNIATDIPMIRELKQINPKLMKIPQKVNQRGIMFKIWPNSRTQFI